MSLGLAQLAHRRGERSKTVQQRASREAATRVPSDGDQPRGRPQPVPVARAARDLAVGCPGRAVIAIRRDPQARITQPPGRRVDGVARCPRRVGGRRRISRRSAPDVLRHVGRFPGGVPV